MKKYPNILFLMMDEHRADVTGFEGNKVIKTPTLDKLAEEGVVFRNAYTPSPICIPARQCMMSGQYPTTCNCMCFGEDLKPGYMTFSRWLSRYSYAAVACGKLHHVGTDQMQGWTQRVCGDMEIYPNFVEGRIQEEFDRNVLTIRDVKWSQEKEVKRAGIGKSPYQVTDEYTVQGAVNFIDSYFINAAYDREQGNRPLLLKVSLNNPHYPYLADEGKFKYYLNRVETYINEEVFSHSFLSMFNIKLGENVSERELRRATAAYYAMIETADEQFNKVIEALEFAGQNLEDWIIIYTSDHGEMLGQHGVWEKQKFFEGSARVPLIIKWGNKIKHRVVHENVNLCDIFATLCDLLEIDVPEGLDSRSLKPLMFGDNSNWNNETLSYFNRTNLMIKRDSLKYQYYKQDNSEVLFDLDRNPEETINFINNEEYKNKIELFRKRKVELGY